MKYGYLGKTEIAFEMAQPETQEKVHSCVSQGQLAGRTLVFILLTAHMQSSYALVSQDITFFMCSSSRGHYEGTSYQLCPAPGTHFRFLRRALRSGSTAQLSCLQTQDDSYLRWCQTQLIWDKQPERLILFVTTFYEYNHFLFFNFFKEKHKKLERRI